jgi:hypothetical protein
MARLLNILLGSLLLSCCWKVDAHRSFAACAFALSPEEGPSTGHTAVILAIAGYIPWEHDTFFCRFEDVVKGAVVVSRGEGPTLVSCVTPPGVSGESVLVRMSLDGVHFSAAGPTYKYTEESKNDTPAEKASYEYLPYSFDNCVYFDPAQ